MAHNTDINLGDLLTWMIVLLGWFVVNAQNNWRETRKERRALIDRIQSQLDALEKDAFAYHMSKKQNSMLSLQIKFALSRLASIINQEDLLGRDNQSSLRYLRRAITYENFDTATFTQKSCDDLLINEISHAKDDLIDEVEARFRRDYRDGFVKKLSRQIRFQNCC